MVEFKGSHFEHDVILWGVRWYVAYPISYRQLEEMMEERGSRLTIRRSIAGLSNTGPSWSVSSVPASCLSAPAGG